MVITDFITRYFFTQTLHCETRKENPQKDDFMKFFRGEKSEENTALC